MALRMLGRRAPNGSLTVLGDFAQATAPAATSGWPEVARHLGVETSAKRCDLVVGYRLPASILDWANRLLAEASTRSQPGAFGSPRWSSPHRRSRRVGRFGAIGRAYGVIASPQLAGPIRDALAADGLDVSVVNPPCLDHTVSVLTPSRCSHRRALPAALR